MFSPRFRFLLTVPGVARVVINPQIMYDSRTNEFVPLNMRGGVTL